jgi:hypothetical protein
MSLLVYCVNAEKITNPVQITLKNGNKRYICPSTWSGKQKDEFLGSAIMPKQKMRCRSGLRYNEKAGTYDQCHGEHYTEEHDKLHPAQASAKQIIPDEAGPWRDRHPLADTDLSVTEDEWNALAAEGHALPSLPNVPLDLRRRQERLSTRCVALCGHLVSQPQASWHVPRSERPC